jgi:hypothetical protein
MYLLLWRATMTEITLEQAVEIAQSVSTYYNNPEKLHAFAKAIQAQTRREVGWQPIETAPKDNSILLTDGWSVGEGFWHDGSECYGHRGKEGWFWESDRGNLLIASNAHATHWMPLPPPPQEQSKETK